MILSKREEYVRSKGLCYNCLIPFHRSKDCRKWSSCRFCKKKHCSLLHPKQNPAEVKKDDKDVVVGAVVGAVDGTCSNSVCIGLPIVPVKIRSKIGEPVVTWLQL